MAERSRALNALIGAAVTVVLTFIPFSSVLGGAVAGYLQGGEVGEGVRVGALSGAFAAVPMLVLVFFLGSVLSLGMMGAAGPRMVFAGGLVLVFGVLFALLYVVGLSAVGGAVGAAVKGNPAIDPEAEA